jgi:hypothetical protein
MPQLLSSKTVRARKAHGCQTCSAQAIAPGEIYARESYVFDGRAYTWIQCLECAALVGIVWEYAYYPDEGIDRDDYYTWATETVEHADTELGRLAAAYLERFAR